MEKGDVYEIEKSDPEIEVSFSIEQEVSRVNEALKRLAWYRENYGDSNIRLPKGISDNSSPEDVVRAVQTEFAIESYGEMNDFVQEKWSEISDGLNILNEIKGFSLLENYSVHLTKYGSGGSYNTKDGRVIINIETIRPKEKIVPTIVHEIIHIGIQYFIEKNEVKHWYKERLVDLISEKYFPGIRRMQQIKEDIATVDSAFNQLFPDIDAITKAIGEMK